MEEQNKAVLGTGWGFPIEFDKPTRSIRLVSAQEDINESLYILLSTRLGERVMQPNYGCNLHDYVFEPLSPTMTNTLKEMIRVAILYNEPRIRLERLDLIRTQNEEGVVIISLEYTILNTNSRFNFVYPFYLQEST